MNNMWIEFDGRLVNFDYVMSISTYDCEPAISYPRPYIILIKFHSNNFDNLGELYSNEEERDIRYKELKNKFCGYPLSNKLNDILNKNF